MNAFKEYDVSIHVIAINLKTGIAHTEVCVQDGTHTGICRAPLEFAVPSHLLGAVKVATERLLDQHGPFRVDPDEERGLYHLCFTGDPIEKLISTWSERSSAEAARTKLNRIWREKQKAAASWPCNCPTCSEAKKEQKAVTSPAKDAAYL